MFLIVLTIALGIAVVVLGTITWRLLRLERQRAESRIASLAAAIDDPLSAMPGSNARDEESLADLRVLFASGARPGTSPARFVAAALLVAILGASTLWFARRGADASTHQDASATQASSVELLSMRHLLDGDTLIVTGFVRNPSTRPTAALTAVVSALDRGGEIVARGQARLNPGILEPGKETSFRVTLTQAGGLGRYRLGFVDGDQVVPHVDRRRHLTRTAMLTD